MYRNTIIFLLCAIVCAAAVSAETGAEPNTAPKTPTPSASSTTEPTPAMTTAKTYTKPSAAELAKKLSPIQYHVTQRSGTEPPFDNEFWDNHESGLYVDIVTGEPLFSSRDKFNSGTGWPSFTKPIEANRVTSASDMTHGMVRNEVRSKAGDSHLGHVFDDGPAPTHTRYCINSASLRFIPTSKLEAEGYGQYKTMIEGGAAVADATNNSCALPKKGEAPGCAATIETVVLAGGCFWGMQDLLRKIPGVITTEVGYCGGTSDSPTYSIVKTGSTGHAESVKVTFDKSKLSFDDLLEKWFFRMHDPTTLNRQGNDTGSQYRSAIFCTTDEQVKLAAEAKAHIEASGKWSKPIVTEIVKAGKFTPAEDYHQDYLVNHPGGYTCHYLRDWKDVTETKETKEAKPETVKP